MRVIDIETIGTDPATDAIIEIAGVDMVPDGGITNAMDTLVRSAKPIPPASAIGANAMPSPHRPVISIGR
jgi:DNA polymerase III epsilon subunit-like protein